MRSNASSADTKQLGRENRTTRVEDCIENGSAFVDSADARLRTTPQRRAIRSSAALRLSTIAERVIVTPAAFGSTRNSVMPSRLSTSPEVRADTIRTIGDMTVEHVQFLAAELELAGAAGRASRDAERRVSRLRSSTAQCNDDIARAMAGSNDSCFAPSGRPSISAVAPRIAVDSKRRRAQVATDLLRDQPCADVAETVRHRTPLA